MHDTKTSGCLNTLENQLENNTKKPLENAAAAAAAHVSEKPFAQKCFEAWKNHALPTGDNTPAEWLRRDFGEGVKFIRQYGYTQEQVLQAIDNIGQLKKMIDSGESWAVYTATGFSHFCKNLNKYVPGAFSLDSYRNKTRRLEQDAGEEAKRNLGDKPRLVPTFYEG